MSGNYKQKIIPNTLRIWGNLQSLPELRTKVYEYYRENIFGNHVINIDKGYKIIFSNKPGGRKIAFGGSMYKDKAEAIKMIIDLLKYAKYSNWKNRKIKDNKTVLGYLNFKAKGKINYKLLNFRISVQLRKDGNLYYNHEINIIKNKKA